MDRRGLPYRIGWQPALPRHEVIAVALRLAPEDRGYFLVDFLYPDRAKHSVPVTRTSQAYSWHLWCMLRFRFSMCSGPAS